MLRILFFCVLLSSCLHAQVPTNNTLLNLCSADLVICTNYNATYNTSSNSSNYCVDAFNSCYAEAQINLRPPQSCYQANAAKIAFKYAWMVVLGIVGTSIAIPNLLILVRYLIGKCSCCACFTRCTDSMFQDPPKVAATNPPEPTAASANTAIATTGIWALQSMTVVTANKLGLAFSGLASVVSANWLFPLWKDQTFTDANCKFDSYEDLPKP